MSGSIARRIRRWAAALVAVAGTAATQANADTLYVNGDCGNDDWTGTSSVCAAPNGPKLTIQAGIDASLEGDTVMVADGTYTGAGNKNLDFGGRAITVRSEFGPTACIIDCERDGRGFYFHNGETADAVLQGITIRNGLASDRGGAILCEFASPTIRNGVFANCEAKEGGGLYNSDSDPTLTDCIFNENSAHDTRRVRGDGGGMYNLRSDPTLTRCTLSGNSAGVGASGGGMFNLRSNPTLIECTISGNTTGGAGRGAGMYNNFSSPTVTNSMFSNNTMALGGHGGGMYLNHLSSPIITDCTFSGNEAHWGGGINVTSDGNNPTLTRCTFSGNSARFGGALFISPLFQDPVVYNCTFSENSGNLGGAVYLSGDGDTVLRNCTFSRNVAKTGGAIYRTGKGNPVLTGCILWNDTPEEIAEVDGAVTTVRFSNVQGGWQGEGNIDADPLFVDPLGGDLHLSGGSLSIDAGDPLWERRQPYCDTDLDHEKRIWDGDGNGVGVVDMGAYEFDSHVFGDLNCDGAINAFDIEAFILAVFDPDEYSRQYPDCDFRLADNSCDRNVNAFDIEPFLDLLFP